MESYSILPLLFMVYFVVVAAGCAELPYKAKKRCPLLFYGSFTGAMVLLVLLMVNLFAKQEMPAAGSLEGYIFWPCCFMLFTFTCVGMIEVSKRRIQKKLSSIEFCLSEVFLSGSIFSIVVYVTYLLLTRGNIF